MVLKIRVDFIFYEYLRTRSLFVVVIKYLSYNFQINSLFYLGINIK